MHTVVIEAHEAGISSSATGQSPRSWSFGQPLRRTLRTSATLLAAWVALGLFVTAARAEIPNLSTERLVAEAQRILVGPIVNVEVRPPERKYGREVTVTTIRVLRVEKGEAQVGSEVAVFSWYREQVPGTTGMSGHRLGTRKIGQLKRFYIRNEQAILPNGADEPEPMFVTPALLGPAGNGPKFNPTSDQIAALAIAASAANDHTCWVEAERGWERLTQWRRDAMDTVRLAQARAGQGRADVALAALNPLADAKLSKEEAGQGAVEARAAARRAVLDIHRPTADTSPEYVRALVRYARVDESRGSWQAVRDGVRAHPKSPAATEAAREADAALAKLANPGDKSPAR
jgi:hypothetical protein